MDFRCFIRRSIGTGKGDDFMELKAVREYEKPECPTMEENKNRVLLMMVRTGKISLGVAVMCLLCNCSLANEVHTTGEMVDSVEDLGPVVAFWCKIGIIFSVVVTLILGLINYKNYKKCEDIEEKERLRKRKNKIFIVGGCICALFVILSFL